MEVSDIALVYLVCTLAVYTLRPTVQLAPWLAAAARAIVCALALVLPSVILLDVGQEQQRQPAGTAPGTDESGESPGAIELTCRDDDAHSAYNEQSVVNKTPVRAIGPLQHPVISNLQAITSKQNAIPLLPPEVSLREWKGRSTTDGGAKVSSSGARSSGASAGGSNQPLISPGPSEADINFSLAQSRLRANCSSPDIHTVTPAVELDYSTSDVCLGMPAPCSTDCSTSCSSVATSDTLAVSNEVSAATMSEDSSNFDLFAHVVLAPSVSSYATELSASETLAPSKAAVSCSSKIGRSLNVHMKDACLCNPAVTDAAAALSSPEESLQELIVAAATAEPLQSLPGHHPQQQSGQHADPAPLPLLPRARPAGGILSPASSCSTECQVTVGGVSRSGGGQLSEPVAVESEESLDAMSAAAGEEGAMDVGVGQPATPPAAAGTGAADAQQLAVAAAPAGAEGSVLQDSCCQQQLCLVTAVAAAADAQVANTATAALASPPTHAAIPACAERPDTTSTEASAGAVPQQDSSHQQHTQSYCSVAISASEGTAADMTYLQTASNASVSAGAAKCGESTVTAAAMAVGGVRWQGSTRQQNEGLLMVETAAAEGCNVATATGTVGAGAIVVRPNPAGFTAVHCAQEAVAAATGCAAEGFGLISSTCLQYLVPLVLPISTSLGGAVAVPLPGLPELPNITVRRQLSSHLEQQLHLLQQHEAEQPGTAGSAAASDASVDQPSTPVFVATSSRNLRHSIGRTSLGAAYSSGLSGGGVAQAPPLPSPADSPLARRVTNERDEQGFPMSPGLLELLQQREQRIGPGLCADSSDDVQEQQQLAPWVGLQLRAVSRTVSQRYCTGGEMSSCWGSSVISSCCCSKAVGEGLNTVSSCSTSSSGSSSRRSSSSGMLRKNQTFNGVDARHTVHSYSSSSSEDSNNKHSSSQSSRNSCTCSSYATKIEHQSNSSSRSSQQEVPTHMRHKSLPDAFDLLGGNDSASIPYKQLLALFEAGSRS